MEWLKYFDKQKILTYVVDTAKERKIPLNKLVEGIYDPSNFYKITRNPESHTISGEKMIELLFRLNISFNDLIDKCTIFDKETLEAIEALEENENHFIADNRNEYIEILERTNTYGNREYDQYILSVKGANEVVLRNYDKAIELLREALAISGHIKLDQSRKLLSREANIWNDLFIAEFFRAPSPKMIDKYKVLLNVLKRSQVTDDILIFVYFNYCFVLYYFKEFETAYTLIQEGLDVARKHHAQLYYPLLQYLKGKIEVELNIEDGEKNVEKGLTLIKAQGNRELLILKYYGLN